MKSRLADLLRRALVSVCMSAAMLALVNSETIWREYHHEASRESLNEVRSVDDFTAEPREVLKSMNDDLRWRIGQDVLLKSNPFADLENQLPLEEILRRPIANFRREAYRSSHSNVTDAYDLLAYEIDNQDGSHSSILTYVETRKGGRLAPFVVLVTPEAQGTNSYYFRSGKLLDKNRLTRAEASTLISRHMSGGTPTVTVSR